MQRAVFCWRRRTGHKVSEYWYTVELCICGYLRVLLVTLVYVVTCGIHGQLPRRYKVLLSSCGKKKKKQNCAPKPFASLYYLALWWWAVPLTLFIIQCTWTILEFNEKILTIKPPPKWVLFGPYSVDYGERNCIGKSTTAQLSGFILDMSRPSAAEHKYSYSLASEYQNPSERKKKFRCKR